MELVYIVLFFDLLLVFLLIFERRSADIDIGIHSAGSDGRLAGGTSLACGAGSYQDASGSLKIMID